MRTARGVCPQILSVLTKIDLYPEWRSIQGLDVEHLRREGLPVGVLPVSSALRARALRAKDTNLNEESGFPALLAALEKLLQTGAQIAARMAANDILAVVDQLELVLRPERDTLADPDGGAAM